MKISKFFLHFFCKIFGQFNKTSYLCNRKSETTTAKIAQLVEHDLAKVGVAGSSPVFRSNAKINPWSLLTTQADEFKSGWRNW